LPHDKICQLIVSERTGKPIDAKTLRSAFRAELDRGAQTKSTPMQRFGGSVSPSEQGQPAISSFNQLPGDLSAM
jgi:hypothetical protein